MADNSKYNGSTWDTGFTGIRKTATETLSLPQTIYADGTAATVSLKGNTVQNGTPTPSNPVAVNGVGEETANLFNKNATNSANGYVADARLNGGTVESNSNCNVSEYISVDGATTYTMSGFYAGWSSSLAYYDTSQSIISYQLYENKSVLTFTTPANAAYIRITISKPDIDTTIINEGSTAKPYEPYGYKIPILTNQTTTNIYIGDNPLRKSLDGTAYDTLDSNGTLTQRVDSDGSVLATPIVSQITVPSIPTVDGANTITVDTTVQPSEFTATWTGWHDASVKEWDGSQWE
jgi:hypothetical protein